MQLILFFVNGEKSEKNEIFLRDGQTLRKEITKDQEEDLFLYAAQEIEFFFDKKRSEYLQESSIFYLGLVVSPFSFFKNEAFAVFSIVVPPSKCLGTEWKSVPMESLEKIEKSNFGDLALKGIDLSEAIGKCLSPKRFLILVTESRSMFKNLNEAIYQTLLRENKEEWDSFNLTTGEEFPLSKLVEYDGIVVTGGNFNVWESLQTKWFLNLAEIYKFLRAFGEKEKKPKVLAFCLGHQSLAQTFGGQTEKMKYPDGSDMYMGKERIVISQDKLSPKLMGLSEILGKEFTTYSVHRNGVVSAPKNGKIVCSSASCQVEMIEYEEDWLLGTQFHPEYTTKLVERFIEIGKSMSEHDRKMYYMRKETLEIVNWHLHQKAFVSLLKG